jgi:hypothetical protein
MALHPHKGPLKRLKHVDAVETRQPKYTQGWYTAMRAVPSPQPLLSINSPMGPRAEPDNAQDQRREDSNIKQCINHGSLH